jgi:hypothetical protein
MRLSYTASYPFLLVAVRVLYLAANNPGEFSFGDLLVSLGTCLGATMVVYLVSALLLRKRGEGRLPAFVTLVVVAWVFGAPAMAPAPWSPPPAGLAAAGLVGSALLTLGLARRPAVLRIGATYLTHTYAILVLWLVGDIALDWHRQREQIARSLLIQELGRPVQASLPIRSPTRNLYVIVLDEYANRTVLRGVLGFDNGPFEDSLRALGFHVPSSVRSNYVHTYLSLASLLNAAHVHPIEQELPPGTTDRTLANHLVAQNRVARFLQGHGYRFVFFPSSWWHSTHSSPIADSVVQVYPTFSVGRSLSQTAFRRILWQNTPIAWFYREAEGDAEIVRGTLEGIGRLPREHGPIFAFAHAMSPHRPYVLDSSCAVRPAGWRREAPLYVAQLQCLNALLLQTVTHLIRDSEVEPIIVLQGDHGTSFLRYSSAPSASQVPVEAARERFGAFGAYYLPGNGTGAFSDTVSVVNVLGLVLRQYFGADLPPQPDEHYLSLERSPFAFRRMDPGWLGLSREPQ